jgi:hypothetical protein
VAAGSEQADCACVIEFLQERLPFTEFARTDLKLSAGMTPSDAFLFAVFVRAKLACGV